MTLRSDAAASSHRRFLTDDAVERLAAEILRGEHRPGASLRDEELAQRWGVSRKPIHDALVRLHIAGLVDAPASHGTRVATLAPIDAARILVYAAQLASIALVETLPRMGVRSRHQLARAAGHYAGDETVAARSDALGALLSLRSELLANPLQRAQLLQTCLSAQFAFRFVGRASAAVPVAERFAAATTAGDSAAATRALRVLLSL